MATPEYNEKHCEKHNQYYAEYLSQCPICRGEELNGYMKTQYNGRLDENNIEDKGV